MLLLELKLVSSKKVISKELPLKVMFGDTGQALHKRKADVCTIKISDNHS
jgi:hypothetical protein